MRRKGDLPKSVMLPSGRIVHLSEKKGPQQSRAPGLFGDAIQRIETALRMKENGEPVHVGGMVLADFHALRAILTRIGWLDEEEVSIECVNCKKPMRIQPCETFELGPFVDREITSAAPKEDPFVKLEPCTVARARPLHEALQRGSIRPSKKLVRAMGIVTIDGKKDALEIARFLRECDDATFDRVTDAFMDLAYPETLVAVHMCKECGARNDVDAPWVREFTLGPRTRSEGFPSFEEFDEEARKIAEDMVPRDVMLVVEGGVPECDDGGVPLLGGYLPPFSGSDDMPSRPAEISVYYRTFRAMYEDEGEYDWIAELRETIEHELEHHEHRHGDDPMDASEREEIVREVVRIVGKKELARRETRALFRDWIDFGRRTWPLWLGLLMLAIFWAMCGH